MTMFKCISKSTGSYFGRFKSADDALDAATSANDEKKAGLEDWEPEEKASTEMKPLQEAILAAITVGKRIRDDKAQRITEALVKLWQEAHS